MNAKKMSKIRNKAKHFLVLWLQSLLNKEEADKINIKNVFNFIPNQTHYWQDTTLRLQPWSYKWIVKKQVCDYRPKCSVHKSVSFPGLVMSVKSAT